MLDKIVRVLSGWIGMFLSPFLIFQICFTLLISGFRGKIVGKTVKHDIASDREVSDDCVSVEFL